MIFNSSPSIFESEKERNLYYKVFAGYVFNEFIPGIDQRVRDFCELVYRTSYRGLSATEYPIAINPETAHVSFDNYEYMFYGIAKNKGEFADVLIHDRCERILIAIEAKVHDDWSYDKDILENDERLRRIEAQLGDVKVVPCLLLKSDKWDQCRRKINSKGSHYRRFNEETGNRFRVLLWEDIIALCKSKTVQSFADSVLSHPPSKAKYNFSSGWFERR